MAHTVGSLGGAKDFLTEFFASAAITAGQFLVREATASNLGEAADPSAVTAAADALGVAEDAATSNTSPTAEPGRNLVVAAGSLENLVRVNINPLAIYRFAVSGSATSGTALVVTTSTPAHILTNDTADTTAPYALITDTAVGTVDMSGGLVKGLTGNNVGAIRKLISQVNSTSCTVGIGFVNTLAANDTFIRVPFGRSVEAMQFTTDFTEANGIIATGTGAPFGVVNVIIDIDRTLAWVDVVSRDHHYNPLD